jgi:cystathionine beta-lyase/cystathionine gamma-synthase
MSRTLSRFIRAANTNKGVAMYTENQKKFVFIVNEKFNPGAMLNAYGHVALGLAGMLDQNHTLNEVEFLDYHQDGNIGPALLSTYPVIVLKAKNGSQLRRLRDDAQKAGLYVNYFTHTMNGESARGQLEATRSTPVEQQEFAVVALFGPQDILAPLTKRFSLLGGATSSHADAQPPVKSAAADAALQTKAVHAGDPRPRIGGSAAIPIFQSTVFEYKKLKSYHDIEYPRFNSLPNQLAVAAKIASLESGEDAVVTASGMAAITTTLLTILGKGSHCLFQEGVYGGTHNFLTDDMGDFGMTYDLIDANKFASWEAKLLPNTRAIYVEAITNPLLHVADHRAVVKFARTHGLVSIIDNTFATPVNFRPLELGYDLSLHSATKYLNGHSDLVAGVAVGRQEMIGRIRHRLNHLGGCLDPHACFLLDRGLKTLVLRVRQQNESAATIASFLTGQPQVARVNYPGLETHPHYNIARDLFSNFGGMLSFELTGGAIAADEFVNSVKLPIHAASLGGVESLVTRPATTSHSGLSSEERTRLGITDGLIRYSVGIEDTDELIDDLSEVLSKLSV